jgi:hypothetical protein
MQLWTGQSCSAKEPVGGGGKERFKLQGLIQEDTFLGFAGRGPCYKGLVGILLSGTEVQDPAREPYGLQASVQFETSGSPASLIQSGQSARNCKPH